MQLAQQNLMDRSIQESQRQRPFDQTMPKSGSLPAARQPYDQKQRNSFMNTSDSFLGSNKQNAMISPTNRNSNNLNGSQGNKFGVGLGNSTMGKAGAQISGTMSPNSNVPANMRSGASIAQSNGGISQNAGQQFSFKEALQQIEEETLLLAAELNYCKREMGSQRLEFEQVCQISENHCSDVEIYLKKEVQVLDEIILKQKIRQNAEYTRLYRQVAETEAIGKELEGKRSKAVNRVAKIQNTMGIETDVHETFMQTNVSYQNMNNSPLSKASLPAH